jgi:teichuronopeptide biosynthesis TupA-like protein
MSKFRFPEWREIQLVTSGKLVEELPEGARPAAPIIMAHTAPAKPIESPVRYALIPFVFKLRKLMSDALYLNAMYYLSLGTLPRFQTPRTFNEMINHRKLYDRNPAFIVTSDKYAVRDYVAERVGAEYLVPLLAHETNPREIDFAALPRAFAVKLNHGSGLNILVTDKAAVNWEEILLKLQRWMRFPYHKAHREWAYQQIMPRVLVEELLQDRAGNLPDDYKLHVFHGKVRLIQVHYDRFGEQRINLFDERYRLAKVRYQAPPALDRMTPPRHLDTMIAVAERLAAGFNYARIDLYEHRDRVYFGEITHYPAAGIGVFDPPEFDRVLGDLWLENRPIPERYFT